MHEQLLYEKCFGQQKLFIFEKKSKTALHTGCTPVKKRFMLGN